VEDLPEDVRKASADPANAVGGFVLVAKLGRGGMGEVWKAWQRGLSRWVAIKFLTGGEEQDVERFLREARIAAKLHHPNIVPVYEVGRAPDGRHFISMGLVDGRPLDREKLDPRRAVEVVRDAARAVHYSHEQGVIHRDLKPQNVMLGRDGRVFVMDFGLARPLKHDRRMTVSGELIGTPSFMPPEQARGDLSRIGPASDVYGLGATLYAVLARRAPFEADNIYDVLAQVVEADPPTLRVARDLQTIVAKSMEKDAAGRYASAAAFADDLQRFLDGRPIEARPISVAGRAAKWIRRNRAVSSVAALLVAAGAVLAVTGGKLRQTSAALEEREKEERQRTERRARALPHTTSAARHLETAGQVLFQKGATLAQMRSMLDQALGDIARALAEDEGLAEAFYLRGRARRLAGEPGEALADLTRALELEPGHVGARLERFHLRIERLRQGAADPSAPGDHFEDDIRALEGSPVLTPDQRDVAAVYIAYGRRRFEQCIGLLDVLIVRSPARPDLYMMRGFARGIVAANPAVAEQDYREAVERKPGYFEAWYELGHILETRKSDAEAAAACYERSLAVHPGYVPAAFRLAAVRRAQSRSALAIDLFDRLARERPSDAGIVLLRGASRLESGTFADALADFDEALRMETRSDAKLHRAVCLMMLDRNSEAEEALAGLVEDRAWGAQALMNRAVLRTVVHRDIEGALKDYEAALKLRPRDPATILHNRALTQLVAGRGGEALADLDAALAARDCTPWRLLRSGVNFARGDFSGASVDFHELMRRDRTNVVLVTNLGSWLATRDERKGAEALEAVDKYVATLGPRASGRRYRVCLFAAAATRGRAWLALGDAARAEADFTRSLEVERRQPEVLLLRAQARRRLGRDAEADADAARAREIDASIDAQSFLGYAVWDGVHEVAIAHRYQFDGARSDERVTSLTWTGFTHAAPVTRR